MIFVAALCQIASSAISLGAAADPGDVIADFSDVRQHIDGFGGSDKRNPLFTDTDADLFFSQSQGIGLSILRASIDTNGAYTNGSYANATKAAARGALVWAAPWTPPAAWKDNGNVNNGGHLLPAFYDAWASRLANFANLLQQNAGVPLYGLSVQNEPDYLASYNSALYTSQQMVDFIKVLGPKLAALTPRPRLIAPDSAYWTSLWDYSAAIMADPLAASNTDILAVHQYFAPAPTPHAIPPGKPLWQTEMSSFESFSTDIGNGITVAKWIHNALVDASVSAWHYWWLIGLNGDNEGLVNAGGEASKRLYTLGNFSKFVRPGFVRVGTSAGPSGVYVSAYKDPASNTVAIVAINDSASSVPFGLTMNGIAAASVTPWVTSATEDLVARAPITVSAGRFTMTLSPSSVTTFVSGNPVPPSVAGLSPTSGGTGTLVTITGTNFGSAQGTSTVQFNGAAATPTSWSNSSIVALVPNDATIGPVVVTVNGVASNGAPFIATTAAASSYVFDRFSGANGTSLSSHMPNIGGAWIDDLAGNKIFGNRLEATSFGSGRNHNTTRPATADYEVSVDVTMNLTGSGSKAGVEGRVQTDLGGAYNSKYEAYFSEGTHTWYLDKWSSGNRTNLGSFADAGFTSGTKTLKLGMVGTAITVYLNGTSVISATDSSVSAAGYPGIYNEGGIHNGILLDSYLVTNAGGPVQPPGTPTSPNPANGSNGVSTTPTLTWNATGASTYDVRFGTTTSPPLISTATSASYTTVPLTAGTTYFWQIVASNSAGTATGPLWSFTTATAPPPATISGLAPTSGPVGTSVTITGANFGATRGSSAVAFNGTAATPTSWSGNSIVTPVPSGATTGSVVVTVGGVAGNGVTFTVTTPTPLPAPWTSQDVGSPAVTGQATYLSGTFSVSGAGADIWDTNDQFRFAYQTLDGDGEIVALVSSLQNVDGWTKAGVMIREDLTGGAPNAMAMLTPGHGLNFQQRVTRGGPSTGSYASAFFPGAAPVWVRLVRSGNVFSGYYSSNGTAWTLMGSSTVPMASHAYIGLAVTSHNPGGIATATFSSASVASSLPNRPPALTPPANQTSAEGSSVSLQLVASDPDGNPLTYSATNLPASLSVNATTGLISGVLTFTSAGTYSVTATASDGTLSDNKTFSWTVSDVSQAPSITSLSPTSGPAGTPVTISGGNFGPTQGASSVYFNGSVTTPTNWSASSIVVPVPSGATTGSVTVTVGGVASNGVTFTVTASTPLPAPWTSQDVGNPAVTGQASYSSSTFSVSGAGADIWGTNDQFRFVYQTLDGDGEIVALVSSLQNVDGWTKAGVMIREDLTGGAPNAMAMLTPGHGLNFQQRVTRGGQSTGTYASAFFPGVAPMWVRLVRSGNTFTGYYSATGTVWIVMGSSTIPMASHAYIGMAVTSHNPSLLATATISNASVNVGVTPPSPSLTTLTPAAGPAGTAVTITGAGFGATPGASTVRFNGTMATPISWSATSISVTVPAGATSGLVVVTVGGQASNGVNFSVLSPVVLPAPWSAQDVGGPVLEGRATFATGAFTVAAAGVDIWDLNDQFQFVYRTLDGDGEIVALVGSLQNIDGWTKAGVMIREDLTGSAPNVLAIVTPTNGLNLQQRVSRGALSTGNSISAFFPGVAPTWIRLVRSGNTFTGFYSATGTTWTVMGSSTVPMASRAYIGLAVTSHNPSLLATATFSNVTVSAAVQPSALIMAARPRAAGTAGTIAGSPAVNAAVSASRVSEVPSRDSIAIDSSLAAFWPLNDEVGTTAFDASGRGMNGTLVNGPVWTNGRLGGALSFDGVNDRVVTNFAENLTTWTVAAWVKSPAAPSSASGSGPVDRGRNFQINWNHPDPAFRGAVAMRAGGTWYAASFGALAANTWYHLVGTYDGSTLRAYVNGVLITENTEPSRNPDRELLPLALGARAGMASHFAGVVNGVRIYRYAITAADAAALAQPDATAPSAVTLSASPAGQAVSLIWTAAVHPSTWVSQYRVYRGTTAGGPKTPLAEGTATALSYQDNRTAPFTIYYYEIGAVSADGVEGLRSNEVSVVTGDSTQVPAVSDEAVAAPSVDR